MFPLTRTFFLFLIIFSFEASATIVTGSSNIEFYSTPTNVTKGSLESDSKIAVITEQKNYKLTSNLTVNATTSGLYNESDDLSNSLISTGTLVDSYFVHIDKIGASNDKIQYNGFLTFDSIILGVILEPSDLADSLTTLSLESLLYDNMTFTLDIDEFTLSPDLKSISFSSDIGTGADNIRIITTISSVPISSVPIPAAVWFMGSGLLGLMGFSYKNKAQNLTA